MTHTTAPKHPSLTCIPILRYGQIAPRPAGTDPRHWPALTPEDFLSQMQWLDDAGYTGLAMSALEPYLRGERQGRVVGLTFDAAVCTARHALPVLRDFGFTATTFVVSARLGATCRTEVGHPPYTVMDRTQLRAWVDAGQEVGAHSRHHLDLRTLDERAAWSEIAGCKDDLERLSHAPVRHYCYPRGSVPPVAMAMVRAAGYVTAHSLVSQRVSHAADLYSLPGLSIDARPCDRSTWWHQVLGSAPSSASRCAAL